MATKKVTITTKKGKAGAKETAKKGTKDLFGLVDLPEDLAERGREVWLAGLGALAAVEEEGGKVFKKLVKKGEQWEEDGWALLGAAKDRVGKARGKVESVVEEATATGSKLTTLDDKLFAAVEDAVERGLQRLGVPTRAEVKDLSGKVEKLADQVAALAGVMEKSAAAVVETPREAGPRPKRAVFHVVPKGEGWGIKQEGAEEAVSLHETKKEAVEAGRVVARGQEPSRLVIHKQDGTIQESLAYGE